MPFEPTYKFAQSLDLNDPLADFRSEFFIDDAELMYLDGNSLGRLPHKTRQRLHEVVEREWGADLISSWGKNWYESPVQVGDRIGNLIGAAAGQVVVADSTTMNLFKLVMAALFLQPGRRLVLSDDMNFPTDLYTLQGCIQILNQQHQLRLIHSPDGILANEEEILAAIDEDTALVALSHPTFKSGALYDIPAITTHAHQKGALVIWDLSHAAGVLPLELDRWGVDLAVGCTYKYLNGGPGSPAYLYVRKELQQRIQPALFGWWGHQAPFNFDLEFKPAPSIKRFLVGTPPVLSLSAIPPSLEIIERAGIERIRAKSVLLTEYLVGLYDAILQPLGFILGSPRQAEKRGSHVSIRHPHAYRICQALIGEMKVIPDFREPDNIRMGLSPLYTRFSDIWQAVERIRQVVEEKRYMRYSEKRAAVT